MGESGNGRDVNTWKWRGTDSGRPLQYSANEIIIVFTPSPTSCSYSSISHPHRSMGFFRNQTFALVTSDSTRPTDYSVFDSRVVFTPAPTPCSCSSLSHPHIRVVFTPVPTPCSGSSLSHTHRSMGFFGTKPLSLRQQILWDLLTMVYLTAEYHLHLLYPPSVREASISSSFSWSSLITPTPFNFHFIRYNKHTCINRCVVGSIMVKTSTMWTPAWFQFP